MTRPSGAALVARLKEVLDVAWFDAVDALETADQQSAIDQYERCSRDYWIARDAQMTADSAAAREPNSPATEQG